MLLSVSAAWAGETTTTRRGLDSRRTPNGAAFEELGSYNPHQNPPSLTVDRERVDHWVKTGAHLSPTVKNLLVGAAQ